MIGKTIRTWSDNCHTFHYGVTLINNMVVYYCPICCALITQTQYSCFAGGRKVEINARHADVYIENKALTYYGNQDRPNFIILNTSIAHSWK